VVLVVKKGGFGGFGGFGGLAYFICLFSLLCLYSATLIKCG